MILYGNYLFFKKSNKNEKKLKCMLESGTITWEYFQNMYIFNDSVWDLLLHPLNSVLN